MAYKDELTFTRADVDRLARAMLAQSAAERDLDSDAVREMISPNTPILILSNSKFERVAKVTGARPRPFKSASGTSYQLIEYGGVEFWGFAKEVA